MNIRIPVLLAGTLLFTLAVTAPSAAELEDAPCYECHDELKAEFSQGTVHPPVAEGECDSCHEDHGDDGGLVLVDEVPALCYQCHDEPDQAHVHPPVEDGECLECHNPHHAPREKLLVEEIPALCNECHDDHAEGESVHPPVDDGECLECHNPHQSPRAALLEGRYDRKRRNEFSEEAYELCFECHETEGFQNPDVTDETGFQDRGRNLHYVHLIEPGTATSYGIKRARRTGFSCNACHLVHASPQDKLVRPAMQRGRMTIYTIDFERTDAGGNCVVGCHKPRSYQRGPEG